MTLAAGFTLAGMAWADVDPSRYTSIVDRNPFSLKPPPDPASLVPAPPPPPPVQLATVELTGITSILSSKRAILEIIPGPGKQMLKPILAEGEKVESVEVVTIDIDKSEVIIKNGTVVTNLTFKVAKTTGPTPPGPGGALPPGGAVPPSIPGAAPGVPPQAAFNYSQPPPGRSGVIMSGGAPAYEPPAPAIPSAFGQPGQTINPAAAAAGFRSIPSRTIRSGGLPQAPVPNQPLSAEAQVINLENNRKFNPPHFPPLPPSPLTPQLQPGQ